MKEIPLTRGYVAFVDDEDFDELSKFRWTASVQKNTVYASRSFRDEKGKQFFILMHRQIMGVTERMVNVDHIFGNGLNNQRSNLRTCTHKQNLMNRAGNPKSTSKFKGVSWDKQHEKWVVHISVNGKAKHIGRFESEEDAARQFNQHANKYHEDFAWYNEVSPMFPDSEYKAPVLTTRNTSGFRGVCFKRGVWVARVNFNKKEISLGKFSDPAEAAKAYDAKALELFGDLARLNFP